MNYHTGRKLERRLTLNAAVNTLLLILILALNFMSIPLAVSQSSEEIIEKLKELKEEVSELPLEEAFKNGNAAKGQRKALENKIEAVIHQIEDGAYNSAINKLENDLKKHVEVWITDDYKDKKDLIDKIDEIIRLIKGEIPPPLPDFSIEASPESLTIVLGESDFTTIIIESLNGFSDTVTLSVSDVPSGVTATLDPIQVTPPPDGSDFSILTVEVDLSAVIGTYTITVSGTNDTLEHSVDIIIEIIAPPPFPHFTMKASPTSLTIQQGEFDFSTITIESKNGFSDSVNLEIINVPADVTATLNPEEVTPPPDGEAVSTLIVQVSDLAVPGMYTLTVTGTSDSLVDTVDIELEIVSVPPLPDFSVTVHPSSLSIQQGTSDTATIIVASLNGFSDLVTLTVSPVIEGVTYSLNPPSVTPPADDTITSEITLAVAETAVPNTYMLTLTGTSGTLQHSANLSLEITTAPPPPDTESPTVRIDEPANRSYLAGLVNIVVFMFDENFKRAELTINNTLIALWTPENVSAREQTISWDTTQPKYLDGLYNITLSAEDEAGNTNEETLLVTVDNTKPTVTIDAPAEGSYLRGSVLIRVTGEDKNFYKMNLKIDNLSKKNWTASGNQIYEWNTKRYHDGFHNITLTVQDKAGNSKETSITTFVDNTLPTIEAPTWKPKEPTVDTKVNITVKVSDSQPSSGIQNVTLWYRNATTGDWQPIPMKLNVTNGNWTATIPAQTAETTVRFYIEAFDKAGNRALTDKNQYKVVTPQGIPLAWIAALILLILAATAAAIYFWRKRRKERQQSVNSSRVKNYKLTILLCF
jgi:hypothetical protein